MIMLLLTDLIWKTFAGLSATTVWTGGVVPPDSTVISVLIADDQDLVREGLRMLLESEPDLRVAGKAGNGRQALAQARRLDPDVILMDVRMPEMDGIEATAKLVAGGCRAATRGHGRQGARYVLLARCGRSTVKFTHRAWMIPAAHRTSPMTRPTVA
jgi:hypothetical protein